MCCSMNQLRIPLLLTGSCSISTVTNSTKDWSVCAGQERRGRAITWRDQEASAKYGSWFLSGSMTSNRMCNEVIRKEISISGTEDMTFVVVIGVCGRGHLSALWPDAPFAAATCMLKRSSQGLSYHV
jgi:hypothetical protein